MALFGDTTEDSRNDDEPGSIGIAHGPATHHHFEPGRVFPHGKVRASWCAGVFGVMLVTVDLPPRYRVPCPIDVSHKPSNRYTADGLREAGRRPSGEILHKPSVAESFRPNRVAESTDEAPIACRQLGHVQRPGTAAVQICFSHFEAIRIADAPRIVQLAFPACPLSPKDPQTTPSPLSITCAAPPPGASQTEN